MSGQIAVGWITPLNAAQMLQAAHDPLIPKGMPATKRLEEAEAVRYQITQKTALVRSAPKGSMRQDL